MSLGFNIAGRYKLHETEDKIRATIKKVHITLIEFNYNNDEEYKQELEAMKLNYSTSTSITIANEIPNNDILNISTQGRISVRENNVE